MDNTNKPRFLWASHGSVHNLVDCMNFLTTSAGVDYECVVKIKERLK